MPRFIQQILGDISAAANPPVGQFIWGLDSDGILKKKDDAGNVTPVSLPDLNDRVKASNADTTEGFLADKLGFESGKIQLTLENPGANESIKVDIGDDVFDKTTDTLDDITSGANAFTVTEDEKDALQGTSGNAPNDSNRFVDDQDNRLTDDRNPTSHASSHVDGTDDIQDATISQKGLMTPSLVSDVISNSSKVSADGSVTTHNDVSDAGSGEIITNSERSLIHNPVTVTDTSDIDLTLSTQDISADLTATGVTPGIYSVGNVQVDSKGRISSIDNNYYGTEFNEFYSQGPSFTSAPNTTWVTEINGLTTPLPIGNYKLSISYGWNHNGTTNDFESRLFFDGNLIVDPFSNGLLHKQEPKDSAGGGNPSGTTQQYSFQKTMPISILSAGAKAVLFEFRSDAATVISTVWDVHIEIIRVS